LQASIQLLQMGGMLQQMAQLQQQQQQQQQRQQIQQQQQAPARASPAPSPPYSPYHALLSSHSASSHHTSEGSFPLHNDSASPPIANPAWPPAAGHGAPTADGLVLIHDAGLALRSPSPRGSDMRLYGPQQWPNELHMAPHGATEPHDTDASFSWLVPDASAPPGDASPPHTGGFDMPGLMRGATPFARGGRPPGPGPAPRAVPGLGAAASAGGASPPAPAPGRAGPQQQQQLQRPPAPALAAAAGPAAAPPGPWAPQHGGRRAAPLPPDPLQGLRDYSAAGSLSAADAALVERLVAARLQQSFMAGVAYAQQQGQQQQGQQHAQLQQLSALLQAEGHALGSLLDAQQRTGSHS
jgi:hypothetical protein